MRKSIAAYGSLYQTRSAERGVKRFPTGIPRLDKALNGGLVPGVSYRITCNNGNQRTLRNP